MHSGHDDWNLWFRQQHDQASQAWRIGLQAQQRLQHLAWDSGGERMTRWLAQCRPCGDSAQTAWRQELDAQWRSLLAVQQTLDSSRQAWLALLGQEQRLYGHATRLMIARWEAAGSAFADMLRTTAQAWSQPLALALPRAVAP